MKSTLQLLVVSLVLFWGKGVCSEVLKGDSTPQAIDMTQSDTGVISGTVYDDICDYPLSYANVIVSGTKIGAMVDRYGAYTLRNVPIGYHTIIVMALGYKKKTMDGVLVKANANETLNARIVREGPSSEESDCRDIVLSKPALSRYVDASAVFQVQLALGSWSWNKPLICIITIENTTSEPLAFPIPDIMPLAGDTNKNSVRIYRADGRLLAIRGVHSDYIYPGPLITINAGTFFSWAFCLDRYFEGFWGPGDYELEFWYYSKDSIPGAWQGRVSMPRISYSVRMAGQ